MQKVQQLSSFSAAEGLGRAPMERGASNPRPQKAEERNDGCVNTRSSRHSDGSKKKPSPPSSPNPNKVDKRTRKAGPLPPFIHPLPTIETIMTYPSLSRPVYDSLVRGEAPARTYKTVIHTPKPINLRTLDENLLRSAELSAWRRRSRSRSNSGLRSRSNTGSSTASSSSGYSTNASSVAADSDSSSSEISVPSSPVSISSTSKATTASSPARSPRHFMFPSTLMLEVEQPLLPQTQSAGTSSDPPTREPSPAQSFHSSRSTLSAASEMALDGSASSSTRSLAPSPASSAYPSPPASPEISRRSSSSGEEYMAYPSPPPSPRRAQQLQNRTRRSFSFPAPPTQSPPALTRSTSLNSHPWTESDALEFDLGAQRIQVLPLEEAEDESDEDMEWSMNGGTVVFGAAGIAMSPRAMRGSCCECEHEHEGSLGLYVIDEEEEEAAHATR
ncbi:hypothetical protein CC78DRAFT_383262 [Lojkania enalia]|uniref:Uncharacterized protein n=1 Tax=Lojkania enalia TaxID=147567 RepID=A0A9P4N6Q8_9PLEO|nr:hypothetical protein CC78DRAFT_383262 [Didymosphaeria enalia]